MLRGDTRRLYAGAALTLALSGAPPLPVADPAALDAGARDYQRHCAACHGASGRGNGPVAGALRVPPADLTRLRSANGGTYPADQVGEVIDGRAQVVAHGPRTMPVWGLKFWAPEDQEGGAVAHRIRALVEYLRTLQTVE